MRQSILSAYMLGVALGAAALMSCKSSSAPSAKDPIPTPQAIDPLAEAVANDTRYQPDVKMAVLSQGERLIVRMASNTDKDVWVSAGKFGVILNGEKKVHWFNPDRDSNKFPPVKLLKGAVVTGELQFSGLGSLAGHKLLFKHDEEDHVRPSVAPILDENGRSPGSETINPSVEHSPVQ